MKKFRCHKVVKAKSMTRRDYAGLRNQEVNRGENPDEKGYLVEYLDSPADGTPEGFTNYISWSPAVVFEAGYTEIKE